MMVALDGPARRRIWTTCAADWTPPRQRSRHRAAKTLREPRAGDLLVLA